jgi:hypothetical protein
MPRGILPVVSLSPAGSNITPVGRRFGFDVWARANGARNKEETKYKPVDLIVRIRF